MFSKSEYSQIHTKTEALGCPSMLHGSRMLETMQMPPTGDVNMESW